jgi:hypothetical protein
MKWGAGLLESSRVLKARADRETHTHFISTHHTHSIKNIYPLKDKENTSSFLGKVVGNDGRVFFTFHHLFLQNILYFYFSLFYKIEYFIKYSLSP